MRYHVIINGFSDDYKKQALEILGFIKKCCNDMTAGKTIIISKKDDNIEELSKYALTDDVFIIQLEKYVPEVALDYCNNFIEENDMYIYGSDNFSIENAVRMAARKKGSSIVGVRDMYVSGNNVYAKKMIYSNHMEATFKMKKAPYFITISKGVFECELKECSNKNITILKNNDENNKHILSYDIKKEEKTESIEDAKIIVVAGRGTKNKEAVNELEGFAELIGGKLGISRPVAMSAWASMDKLIGVSGIMAKPKLCITAGVSGSAAFYAGIEKSDFIIAINSDEHSAILKKSDVAIIDDYKAIIDELVNYIK